jgi:hypothetical protein
MYDDLNRLRFSTSQQDIFRFRSLLARLKSTPTRAEQAWTELLLMMLVRRPIRAALTRSAVCVFANGHHARQPLVTVRPAPQMSPPPGNAHAETGRLRLASTPRRGT